VPPRPLCFMVMPYGRKATQAEPGKGPGDVDFNALWDRAYVPVIKKLGYEPVRADQDVGTLIITQMLERLYFADLVLADMTIPNGNVYYEVGIRHASQDRGCVLLAADWSKALFDAAQMRTVRYPLPEGNIEAGTALAIQEAIADSIAKLRNGQSPMHQAIKGYPDLVDDSTMSNIQEYMRDLAELQGAIRAVRTLPLDQRMSKAKVLAKKYQLISLRPPVAIALVRLLRESADTQKDWKAVLDYIAKLPHDLADNAEFREQRAFALSNAGRLVESIAELQTIITRFDQTPERLGMLGGRYKRLADASNSDKDRDNLRNLAISAYEKGMDLDLNGYYCSSNLPRLYRARSGKGDEERAQSVLRQVIMACDRAKSRSMADEWLLPTLLTAAFDAGDANKAQELADEMANFAGDLGVSSLASYKLDSIIRDLAKSADLVADPERSKRLGDLVAKFRTYLVIDKT
jgi:hypothetical protein